MTLRLSLAVGIASLVQPVPSQEDPAGTPPLLEVGKSIEGEIVASDPIIETDILKTQYANAPVRGKRFRIRVDEPKEHRGQLQRGWCLRGHSGSGAR